MNPHQSPTLCMLMMCSYFLKQTSSPLALRCIMQILGDFSTFTGLEVNKDNNSATISKVSQSNPDLQNILGFQVKQLSVMYLGLSYGVMIQLANWIIVDKYTYWSQVPKLQGSNWVIVLPVGPSANWSGGK